MRSDFETIAVDRHGQHTLVVTLNRPNVANAMNTQMGLDLLEVFEGLNRDAADLRVVILTGQGKKAFCAGGDLKQRNQMTDKDWVAQHVIFERMFDALLATTLPVIAAVNGAAYGGGCELAAASDFVYASENAMFALPEVTLGIMPGCGGTQNFARAVGERRAKEVIFSGAAFGAAEGLQWGLINRVASSEDLLPTTLALAERIASNGPLSVRATKQAIHRGLQMSLLDGLAFEVATYNRLIPTADRREGVLAFNEGRKAVFRGE